MPPINQNRRSANRFSINSQVGQQPNSRAARRLAPYSLHLPLGKHRRHRRALPLCARKRSQDAPQRDPGVNRVAIMAARLFHHFGQTPPPRITPRRIRATKSPALQASPLLPRSPTRRQVRVGRLLPTESTHQLGKRRGHCLIRVMYGFAIAVGVLQRLLLAFTGLQVAVLLLLGAPSAAATHMYGLG